MYIKNGLQKSKELKVNTQKLYGEFTKNPKKLQISFYILLKYAS